MEELVCFVVKYTPSPAAETRIKEVIILPTFYVKGTFEVLNANIEKKRVHCAFVHPASCI